MAWHGIAYGRVLCCYAARHIMGSDSPDMGWSRYCETMKAAQLSAALFLLQATREGAALARRMAGAAHGWGGAAEGAAWAAGGGEATALSTELLVPAHDTSTRVGTSIASHRIA